MPQTDLDALNALHAAATPGKIRRWFGGEPCQVGCEDSTKLADFTTPEDAAFYVAAHNALPALLARIAELEAAGGTG